MWFFAILLTISILFNPLHSREYLSTFLHKSADWLDSIQTTRSSGVEKIVVPNPFYESK